MTQTIATIFVYALGAYALVGLVVGVPFVLFGARTWRAGDSSRATPKSRQCMIRPRHGHSTE